MQFEKYVNRIQYLHELIEKQGTGDPTELATRLGISKRMLYYYLDEIKEKREIAFCRKKKSYMFKSTAI